MRRGGGKLPGRPGSAIARGERTGARFPEERLGFRSSETHRGRQTKNVAVSAESRERTVPGRIAIIRGLPGWTEPADQNRGTSAGAACAYCPTDSAHEPI